MQLSACPSWHFMSTYPHFAHGCLYVPCNILQVAIAILFVMTLSGVFLKERTWYLCGLQFIKMKLFAHLLHEN
jgi:hypothetical protein